MSTAIPLHVRVGERRVRVQGPSIRDPRLHLSAVVVTVLTLGIGWMGFDVSIAHLLLSVGVCGALEAALVLRRTGVLVWPASAMQTASSTVLILRVTGWRRTDLWDLTHWQLFVGVSVAGVLTKHVIRVRGRHVFNPSNIALVVAFVLLGSDRIEPLVLWWAPLEAPMVLTYAAIIVGGVLIDRRLRLLEMALTCWAVLAAGIGLLSLQGHAIATEWSFAPVSGGHFWVIVMTSPEILLFCFFMVTDPKTVPAGRAARIRFAAFAATLSVLLAAPWGTEFGTKVGILAGLAVASAARPIIEGTVIARWSPSWIGPFGRHVPVRAVASAAVVAALASVILVLGRDVVAVTPAGAHDTFAGDVEIELATIPTPTIDPDVAGVSASIATVEGARELGATLARNLAIEAEAFRQGDPTILDTVDHGDRLTAQQERIDAAFAGDGTRTVLTYRFDTLHLSVVFPGGAQSGANAGLSVTGAVVETIVDADGHVLSTTERPLDTTFAMREVQRGRWLITNELPPMEGTP